MCSYCHKTMKKSKPAHHTNRNNGKKAWKRTCQNELLQQFILLTLKIPNLICYCLLQALWHINKSLLGISEFLKIRHAMWRNVIFTLIKCLFWRQGRRSSYKLHMRGTEHKRKIMLLWIKNTPASCMEIQSTSHLFCVLLSSSSFFFDFNQ